MRAHGAAHLAGELKSFHFPGLSQAPIPGYLPQWKRSRAEWLEKEDFIRDQECMCFSWAPGNPLYPEGQTCPACTAPSFCALVRHQPGCKTALLGIMDKKPSPRQPVPPGQMPCDWLTSKGTIP